MRTSSKIKIGLLITQVILLVLILLQLYKCDDSNIAKVDSFESVNVNKVVQIDEPPTFVLVASAMVLFKLTKNT